MSKIARYPSPRLSIRLSLSLALSVCIAASTLSAQQATDTANAERAALERHIRDLANENQRRQWQALRNLVRIGKPAVARLTDAMAAKAKDDEPAAGARMAARTLIELGPKATACLPIAFEMLRDGGKAQKRIGLDVLKIIGPYDKEEASNYLDLLFQYRSKKSIKDRVVDAMIWLDAGASRDVDTLIDHLEGGSASQAELGLEMLRHLGKAAEKAIPAIRKLILKPVSRTKYHLRGRNWSSSGWIYSGKANSIPLRAARVLVALGADRDVCAQVNLALLGHGDPAVRQRSVLSLGSLGSDANAKVVTALAKATRDADKMVSWDAITALGMLGAKAKPALKTLRRLSKSKDKARSARAAAATKRIERELEMNQKR